MNGGGHIWFYSLRLVSLHDVNTMHQLYQHYAQQYTMMYKLCQCYAQLLWYNWPECRQNAWVCSLNGIGGSRFL